MGSKLRPFLDSADALTDPPELRRRIDRDGYLFVSGLIGKSEIQMLRRQTLDIAASAGWLMPGTDMGQSIANPQVACVDPEPAYLEVFRPMYRLEALHAIAHHPAVMDLMKALLQAPVLPHPRLIMRNVFPQRPDYTTPPHQDFPHIQGTAETFSVWVPLGDCPIERGGLTIAEGSHKDGVRPFRVSTGSGGMEVVDSLEDRWVASDFVMGDAIIFHSMVVHKALPNLSDRLRQSVDNRYQRVADPLVEASLRPYADLMAWEEIYAGWQSGDYQFYWKNHLSHLVTFDTKYYDERDRMAMQMAEAGDHVARAALLRIVQRDSNVSKRERAKELLRQLETMT
jgi:hypothetical protein